MAFEGRQVGVIGRTPSQLLELGRTILASLDGATDVDALSAELGRVATREKKTLLFDPQESLALPRRDVEAEGKVRTNIWTRVHVRIAEGHLFSTTTDAERHLAQRFAEAVAKLNRNHGDFLGDLRNAVDAIDPECEMASLWKLLAAVVPGNERTRPVMDPIQGAKRFFEERFLSHVHKVARDCGMPTGRTQDAIRMYVHKKLGPHDTAYPAWALVYVSIRCGDYAAATEFASKAVSPGGCRCETPEYYLRTLMQRPSYVACCRFSELEQACLQFMRHGARKKLSSAYRYMLMSVAFLCGQIHVADTLISESAQSWDSLDEFLWFSLGCVRSGSGPSVPFDYKRLRSRLSSYQEMYYTENGRHPMRYALVLFSGLQFGSALYYLMTQNVEAHSFVVHVVHMAIALHHHGLLELPEAADLKQLKPEDVADLVMHYGHSLAASKSQAAWHPDWASPEIAALTGLLDGLLKLRELTHQTSQNTRQSLGLVMDSRKTQTAALRWTNVSTIGCQIQEELLHWSLEGHLSFWTTSTWRPGLSPYMAEWRRALNVTQDTGHAPKGLPPDRSWIKQRIATYLNAEALRDIKQRLTSHHLTDHLQHFRRGSFPGKYLDRMPASRLSQFAANHFPSKQYLFRFGALADSPYCACGRTLEDRDHLLMDCHLFHTARQKLKSQVDLPLTTASVFAFPKEVSEFVESICAAWLRSGRKWGASPPAPPSE